jgi:hypothetical protein
MRLKGAWRASVPLAGLLLCVSPAHAQLYESVGTRAQGMAGAFVAVADDATGSWWNPAGLASGGFFDAVIEYNVARQPWEELANPVVATSQREHTLRSIATAYPALGISYYRLKVSEVQAPPSTDGAVPGRQDQGAILRSLVLNQFGATIGQSVGNHFVIASTVKLVHGTASQATVAAAADATLERARDLSGDGDTDPDFDLGVMVRFGAGRVGLAVKNVTEPSFGSGPSSITLRRQTRAGIMFGTQRRRSAAAAIVAVDADLSKTATVVGEERHVAAGVELWGANRRFGVRGGLSANTVGDSRLTGSAGLSVAVRARTYVEGQLTAGRDPARRGWGATLRMSY